MLTKVLSFWCDMFKNWSLAMYFWSDEFENDEFESDKFILHV